MSNGRNLRRLASLAATLSVIALPDWVGANERSVLLTQEGLALIDGGNHAEAMQRFAAASEADPGDEDARYYLAHTQLMAGKYADALQSLSSGSFEFWDVAYLKGICHLNLDEIDAARTAFEASAQDSAGNPRSHYYLGVLKFRNGDHAGAKVSLEKAGTLDDDLEPFRLLYLGLVAAASGDAAGAQSRYAEVVKADAQSPAADTARELMGGEGAPEDTTAKRADGPFFWDIRAAFQYDDNPGLVQSDATLARIYHAALTDETSALRVAGDTMIGLRFGKREGFSTSIGVGGYTGIHLNNEDADDFNVVVGRAALSLRYGTKRWALELPAGFAINWLGTDFTLYSTTIPVGLLYARAIGDRVVVRGGLNVELQSYDGAPDRDGMEIAVPVDASYKAHDMVSLSGGYTFVMYNPSETPSDWGFTGNRLTLGVQAAPLKWLQPYAGGSFYVRAYDEPFVDPVAGRRDRTDKELGWSLGVRLVPSDSIDIALAYDGTSQTSVDAFTYDRNVLTLSVGVHF